MKHAGPTNLVAIVLLALYLSLTIKSGTGNGPRGNVPASGLSERPNWVGFRVGARAESA
jgi:hypothetical protein